MTLLVVGVGNPDRGDDAVGWEVASAVRDVARVRLSHGEPAGLVEAWQSHRGPAVMVDATVSGRPPGTVTVIDARATHLDPSWVASSHGMGPVEAIELARALGALPESLTFVGVEARCFDPGTEPGPDVRVGADRAISLIRSWAGRGT